MKNKNQEKTFSLKITAKGGWALIILYYHLLLPFRNNKIQEMNFNIWIL